MNPSNSLASDFALPDGLRAAHGCGRPLIVAFAPDEWNPARAQQAELWKQLAAQFDAQTPDTSNETDEDWRCFDSAGEIAAQFGVQGGRAVFVVDETDRIAWSWSSPNEEVAPGEVLAALEALQPTSNSNSGLSRRSFLAATFAASAVLALAARGAQARNENVLTPPAPNDARFKSSDAYDKEGTIAVKLQVNGKVRALQIEPRVALLDALREYIGLTGSKKGCDHGQCGACTVHIDGERQLSCLTLAVMSQGREITTIEGLTQGDDLHPMQMAFVQNDAFQCGYCTPGQIMSAIGLQKEGGDKSDAEIREGMSGNLCRCAAYPNIVAAIRSVSSGRSQVTSERNV